MVCHIVQDLNLLTDQGLLPLPFVCAAGFCRKSLES